MKPNFYKTFALSALLTCSLASIAEASGNYNVRAFYGDKANDEVVVIDLNSWNDTTGWNVKRVKTIGETPYPVDQAGYLDKVYAITRGSSSMDIIDADTLENLGLLPLNHKPRSGESYNSKLGLTLVAGADKPLTSVIDVMSNTVVAEAGKDIFTTPENGDNGGSISSGHPAWLTKDRFVVIDRANRKIQLWGIQKKQHRFGYRYGQTDGQGSEWHVFSLGKVVNTPTSVHHILHRNSAMLSKDEKLTFYALAEGKNTILSDKYHDETEADLINPAILKLTLSSDTNNLSYDYDVDGIDKDTFFLPGKAADMKSHHADFHPNGQHIYVGSNSVDSDGEPAGQLFVIDKETQSLVATFATGAGTGHTRFVPARNLAIVTNHNDNFVTVIDTTNLALKPTEITFDFKDESGDARLPVADEIQQSHTNYVSPDNNFYYAFASAYGVFFEIDLDPNSKTYLEISRSMHTGGVPVQGAYLNSDNFSYSATHSSSSGM